MKESVAFGTLTKHTFKYRNFLFSVIFQGNRENNITYDLHHDNSHLQHGNLKSFKRHLDHICDLFVKRKIKGDS